MNEPQEGDPGPCESCGRPGTWTTDPYADEIHDREEWQYMCDDCHHQSLMDI